MAVAKIAKPFRAHARAIQGVRPFLEVPTIPAHSPAGSDKMFPPRPREGLEETTQTLRVRGEGELLWNS